jgi:hypothetical protein
MTCRKRKNFEHNKLVDVVTNSVSFVGATGRIDHSAPAKMVVDIHLFYVTDRNRNDTLILFFS